MNTLSVWPELPKRLHHSLRILCCLAQCPGPRRARELSRCTGVPPAETAKLLYLLAWGGFVDSRRGSKGGFWLRRPPNRIRIRELIDFFHRPEARSHNAGRDPVTRAWRQATALSKRSFERRTVADLVREGEQRGCSCCLEEQVRESAREFRSPRAEPARPFSGETR